MLVNKKVIAKLNKCYSIMPLRYNNKNCFAVASETSDPCYLFDEEGNKIDTVWEKPGGVMSMIQLPNDKGQFIATQQFYSPDNSKEARLVLATPVTGSWEIKTLAKLPHVHRIDILERNGRNYFIACTVKSGTDYEGDWSKPGKVYAAELPEDLSTVSEDLLSGLQIIADELPKNHGYYRSTEDGINSCLISSDKGVFQLYPPENRGGAWTRQQLINEPSSDAVLTDLDGDGENELSVISPFHGDKIIIYKKIDQVYKAVYQYPHSAEFSHAIYGGQLCHTNRLIIGHREGKKDLIAFTYNKDTKTYDAQVLDHDCGPANIYHYTKDGKDIIISANREFGQIAMYVITPD